MLLCIVIVVACQLSSAVGQTVLHAAPSSCIMESRDSNKYTLHYSTILNHECSNAISAVHLLLGFLSINLRMKSLASSLTPPRSESHKGLSLFIPYRPRLIF
mmetsp:Transcript_1652/g.3289  ORF Transcript_1652/g.3289 Transcript_1652/m.3289 type:complete len:102 (-) Transcript_1652:1387-1692(-)